MKAAEEPSFTAYLDAKRALDDRSVHGPTWRAYLDLLRERLRSASSRPSAPGPKPAAVLELGCGLGALLDRTLRDLGPGPGHGEDRVHVGEARLTYVAIDSSASLLATLRSRFAAAHQGEAVGLETRTGDALAELETLATEGRRFDAVVSHAFADLVDLPRLCAAAARVLVPGGIFYHSLVFDGVTAFFPSSALEVAEDGRWIAAYHASMARPWGGVTKQGGDGRPGASGRGLLGLLAAAPWSLAGAGPSDWIVMPGARRGEEAADEDAVIATMLGFFGRSVAAGLTGEERAACDAWLRAKRARLEGGALGFYAHHLDVLAVLGT